METDTINTSDYIHLTRSTANCTHSILIGTRLLNKREEAELGGFPGFRL